MRTRLYARTRARSSLEVETVLEKDIERFLKQQIEKNIPGAMCLKFLSPGLRGVPDRIILLPGAHVVFAELKKPGKKPGPLQRHVHGLLIKLGFTVFDCVDTKDKALEVVQFCQYVYDWRTYTAGIWTEEGATHGKS